MKKITLFITLIVFTLGFSQAIPVTFDTDITVGAKANGILTPVSANWFSDSGLTSVSVEDIASDTPDHGKAGKIISSASGAKWQNAQILLQNNYIDLRANKKITLDVYSDKAQNFLLKMEQSKEGTTGNTEKSFSHTGAGWESITVDFSTPNAGQPVPNDQYRLFVIFPCYSSGFADPAFDSTTYIDNFSGTVGDAYVPQAQAPTKSAPIPPKRDAGDVVSFYSDAYTDITFPETPTSWSQSGFEKVNIAAGDDIWKFNACNFFAMANYNGVDLSNMEKMHIDYWTPDTTPNAKIFIKLVDTKANVEELVDLGLSAAGSWQSIEIDLSTFKTHTNLSSITQVLYDPTADGSIQFIDNFYFYRQPTAGLEDNALKTVKMFPNPAKDTVQFSVNSNENLDIEIFDMLGKSVLRVNAVQNEVNIADLNSGLYFVQMTLGTQQATKNLVVN